MNNFVAGIDYSITSPGLCLHPINLDWNYKNCVFYFGTEKEKMLNTILPDQFHSFKSYCSDVNPMKRYSRLADKFIDILEKHFVVEVGMENYAFQASGKVFNIAECTGLLKYNMWKLPEIRYSLYSPSEIKKFATNKGNANKVMMVDKFIETTDVDILETFQSKHLKVPQNKPPISDLVDAYWVCKLHHEKLDYNKYIEYED